MVILLVEVKTVGEHLFYVTNFNGHVRAEHAAVNLDPCRVHIIKGPNPQVLDEVVKITTCLEMSRLVLLHWNNWQSK